MYLVAFNNNYPFFKDGVTKGQPIQIVVADQERALALSSMLGKLSTDQSSFTDIMVLPFEPVDVIEQKLNPIKFMLHETEKK